MSLALVAALCVVPAWAQDDTGEDTEDIERESMTAGETPKDAETVCVATEQEKVSCFSWGADLRLREVYIKNPIIFNNDTRDPGSSRRRRSSRATTTTTPATTPPSSPATN